MKLPESWAWPELRQRLVLTSEEKRVIIFIIAAVLLGAGSKCYRDSRPKAPMKIEKKHAVSRHGPRHVDSAKHD